MELEQQEVDKMEKLEVYTMFEEPRSFSTYNNNIKIMADKIQSCFMMEDLQLDKNHTEYDDFIINKIGQNSPFYQTALSNLSLNLVFHSRDLCMSVINWKNNYFNIEYPPYLSKEAPKKLDDNKMLDDIIDKNYFIDKFNFLIKSESETLVSTHGRDIKGTDLNRLRPRVWLNGEIINYYTTILASDEFQQVIEKRYKNFIPNSDFIIFNTYFSVTVHSLETFIKPLIELKTKMEKSEKHIESISHIKVKMGETFLSRIQYVFKKRKFDITKKNYFFIPDHVRNNHWKLYIIKGFKQYYDELVRIVEEDPNNFINRNIKDINFQGIISAASVDSMYYPTAEYPNYHYMLRYAVNFLLVGSINADFGLNVPLNKMLLRKSSFHYYDLKVPSQNNGYDCGLAVVENIEQGILYGDRFIDEIQTDKSTWYNFENLNWKREKLVDIIIKLAKKEPLWVS